MAARRPSSFADLGVPRVLVDALAARGVTTPFPLQSVTLPDALAGRDILGRGRTGSGKTYAFVVPLLARLAAERKPRRPGRPRAGSGSLDTRAHLASLAGDFTRWLERRELPAPTPALRAPPGDPFGIDP
jgi:superfamily II DNA/RNA helicase